MGITIKSTAVASGQGTKAKGADLKEFAKQIPDDALVSFEVKRDQRDGDSWIMSAEWEGASNVKLGLNYPPGVRGGIYPEGLDDRII